MEVGGESHALAALPPRKIPGTHSAGGGLGVPGSLWTGAENLASTGVRSSDRAAHSGSQYPWRYAGPVTEPKVSQDVSRLKPMNRPFRQAVPYRTCLTVCGTQQTIDRTDTGTSEL
jgi:hypothetical protein